ncbi:MAG: M15 family metallopeptidase [Firmicutes bacterium]|nr:M15 family metallopeptidase [Bacillota bacterium]
MKKTIIALAGVLCLLCGFAGAAAAGEAGIPSAFSFGAPAPAEAPAAGDEGVWTYPIPRAILEDPLDVLRLVNREFLLDKSYPDESTLVKATVRKVSSSAMMLRDVASEALRRMFDAAEAEGVYLYLHNAYRDYRTQEVMYYNRLKKNGGKDDGLVQKEGASDHQTGLGMDVISKAWIGSKFNANFAKTPEAQWMAANCGRFGFILRYPEGKEAETGIAFEPWHLRYVGAEVAEYMADMGYTLEAFTAERLAVLRGEWELDTPK